MSVASANPFALLGEEESSPPGSPGPAAKKEPSAPSRPTRATTKSKGPASRGGRYYPRGGKPGKDSTQDGQEDTPVGDESAPKKADGEGRGRGRGRGRGDRGRGRGRPFDKHSATGKTDSDKKIHQGWGGDEGTTELKAEEAGTTDAQVEGVSAANDAWDSVPMEWTAPPEADPWGAPPAPAEGDGTPAVEEKGDDDRKPRDREPEEDDNTISYEQYLAQLKETTTPSVPKLDGVREANEGAEDADAWGDIVEHKRNEDEQAYFVGKTKTTTKQRTEKKEKVYLEIDAHFDRPSRGRGRGGDRGRGRGRGGARGARPNGAPQQVNVDDETAFPSLS